MRRAYLLAQIPCAQTTRSHVFSCSVAIRAVVGTASSGRSRGVAGSWRHELPGVRGTLNSPHFEHCLRSMRSRRSLGHCTTKMSYFSGFTHCRPQMSPNPRFCNLFAQTLGEGSGDKKLFRNGKVPGRTCAHDPARAAEGDVLRSTSVEFSASWWVSVPCVVRVLRAQRDQMPWLAPAGLRGGRKLEVGATTRAASHIPSLCCPSNVQGLRLVAPEALRRPCGQLLRQRHFLSDVASSMMPAVSATAIPLRSTLRRQCVSAVAAQTLGAPSRQPRFSTGGQEAEGR